MDIVQLVGAEDDKVGGLEDLRVVLVGVGDAGRRLAVPRQVDAQDLRPGPVGEVLALFQGVEHAGLRRGLGVVQAAEAFAEAAVVARPQLHA